MKKLSKLTWVILFIFLPISSFYLGIYFRKIIEPGRVKVINNDVIKIYPTDSPRDLIERCGKIPSDKLGIDYGNFTVVYGPFWSPDCRHLTWSVWQSGTSGLKYEGPYPHEGIFLYSEKTGQIQKIYSPESKNETIGFQSWKSKSEILFLKDQKRMIYDIDTNALSEEF